MLFKLTAPNDMAALLPVLAFVEELAQGLGMEKQARLEVRLATEEAVTNVVEHAFEPGEHETFDIICETDSSKLTITIREKGIPFRPCEAAGQDAITPRAAGLGLTLMQGAVDRVIFRNLGRDGKELCLIKHLPSPADSMAPGTAGEPASAHSPRIDPGSFGIRLLRPEDAPEVSRAAYKTYRYTYDDEFIYYPDQIVELNRQGKILSAVAVSEAGGIMGHAAIKRPWADAPVAEVGILLVLPEYRHTRAALKLLQFLKASGEQLGLEGAFARTVSSHTISQKASALFGFKDCAILLGAFYSGIEYRSIDAETGQKESAVVSYCQVKPRAARDIYPPRRHSEMIRSIYDTLGLPANLPECPATLHAGESRLHCSRDSITNTAVIDVENYGTAVVAEVAEILHGLKLDRLDAVYLQLDLEQPLTTMLADEFERMGFFFAGVLPFGLTGRDCLILQYLNNLRMEYSRVRVHSSFGQALLRYIQTVAGGPA
ncbi:MAG: GNAT family N-acetyltransferase [Syntrophobacteraceae bacterium]